MIAVMIALAAGLSGYGLYQRSVEMPRAVAEYAADPEGTAREAGSVAPAGSPQRQHLEDRLKNREPTATFALTNSLAAMLAPWLVLAVGIAASCSPRSARPCRASLAALLIAVCLRLTKSRSSYVAVAVGLALAGPVPQRRMRELRPPGWKTATAGVALAAALVAVVLAAALWAAGLPPGVLAAQGRQVVRLSPPILAGHAANDRRASAGRLRAGQFPRRLYRLQIARGQRRSGRSAQFPLGGLGHGRHAGHAGAAGLLAGFAWAAWRW